MIVSSSTIAGSSDTDSDGLINYTFQLIVRVESKTPYPLDSVGAAEGPYLASYRRLKTSLISRAKEYIRRGLFGRAGFYNVNFPFELAHVKVEVESLRYR